VGNDGRAGVLLAIAGRPHCTLTDSLDARWQAIERRLNQINASPTDQELCHAETERLLLEQDNIEYVLGLGGPATQHGHPVTPSGEPGSSD
jgi:hypothetical protein